MVSTPKPNVDPNVKPNYRLTDESDIEIPKQVKIRTRNSITLQICIWFWHRIRNLIFNIALGKYSDSNSNPKPNSSYPKPNPYLEYNHIQIDA